MLETRLRNHIDALADPVDISDVLGRTPKQTVGDELAPDAVVHEPEFVLASEVAVSGTLGRRPVLVAAVLVVLALVGLLIAARVGGSPTTLVADEESAAVAVAPAGEVSAAAVQSDDFDRCLDVLDTPPQEGLLVTVDDFGQVFVESRDQFDLRVELCEAIINATIERELTGSSTGKALPMSPEQSAALEDGVSDDELEQAWRRFVDCFEGGGGELLGGDSPDYNYSYAAGDEFVHDACASWHFERVSIVASLVRQEGERDASKAEVVTAVADAREAVDSGISSAWSNELAMELESLEECEVLLDESWITTFDSMPQPHCLVVGEEHSFQFWNKGFETAIVDWPGGGRSLSSDSQFETGRIGDVLPAGKHEVAVDPYGDVVLYVMPRSASLLAQVDLGTLNEDGLRGMPVRDLAGLLGLDLVIRTATETCFVAVVRGDPYSPEFVLVGDGTVAGSFFVGLTAHTYGCA